MEGKEPILPTALPVASMEVCWWGGDGGGDRCGVESEGWDGTRDFFIQTIFGELFQNVWVPLALVRKGITSTALLPPLSIRPFALSPESGAGGREVEEEGSRSPGSPPAAPYGRCEAWIMPAASGHPPRGALGAPRRRALRVPRPGPWLTALHLAAFLGGRRVPHDWGDGKMGSGREMGAGAVPAAPQAEVTPASAAVGAVRVPGAKAQSSVGRLGRFWVRVFGELLCPAAAAAASGHSPFPSPALPARPRRPRAPASVCRSPPAGARAGSDVRVRDRTADRRVSSPGRWTWWPGQASAQLSEPDVIARVGVQIPIPEKRETAWEPLGLKNL